MKQWHIGLTIVNNEPTREIWESGKRIGEMYTEENARLAAAAPSLLAALEAILTAPDGANKGEIYGNARAAILRATGR